MKGFLIDTIKEMMEAKMENLKEVPQRIKWIYSDSGTVTKPKRSGQNIGSSISTFHRKKQPWIGDSSEIQLYHL